MAQYFRPTVVEEALDHLKRAPLTVLAGGTDHYPARVGRPPDEDVLDITAIASLRGIHARADGWRIGALTTWSAIRQAELPPWFDGLKLAAREVGGLQVQNAGTIGGNLCNASPAADGVPPLLAMDAEAELASAAGIQRIPLSRLILGNRRTARRRDQLLTAIVVPKPGNGRAAGHFVKLGARRYLVISIVAVAANLEIEGDGRVASARIAVGACSPVPQRLPEAERALLGAPCEPRLGDRVQPEHLTCLSPIDDVRASAEYRLEAALTLVRRTLDELAVRL